MAVLTLFQRANVKPQLHPILTISKVLRSVALTNHSQSMIAVETEVWFCLCQELRGRNISLGMLNDPDPFIIHGKIRILTAFCPMSSCLLRV